MALLCFASNFTSLRTGRCCLSVYVLPLVCGTGFVLNLYCAAVFSFYKVSGIKKNLCIRHYLIALSLFDALQLFLSVFLIAVPQGYMYMNASSSASSDPELALIHDLSVYSLRLFYPVLMAANYASIWTITVICIQRYFVICHPLLSRYKFRCLHRAKTTILLIVVFSMGLNSIRYGEHVLVTVRNNDLNITEMSLDATSLRKSSLYVLVNDGLIYSLGVYIVPFWMLSILTLQIVRNIETLGRNRRDMSPILSDRNRSRRRSSSSSDIGQEKRGTMMVVAIVIMFFLCHTLSAVTRWWELLIARDSLAIEDPKEHQVFWFLQELSNLLVNFNSATNPLIYFVFTRRFRDLTLMRTVRSAIVRRKDTVELIIL